VPQVLLAIVVLPFVMSVVAWFTPVMFARYATMATGCGAFVLSVVLTSRVVHADVTAGGVLRADPLSIVFLLSVSFLYATTTMFSVGYVDVARTASGTRYGHRFYAGLNLFCWSLVVVPLVNGFALLWVAIEITTVVSALLVAIDDTDGSSEAAWKYVLLASLGLGIALLATILMYYAGTSVFGTAYDLSYVTLLHGAPEFPAAVVRLSFGLAVLGYGTKMGLFPVHTWLPDAHSEAPTPVSALLSGALLAVSFYAILRFFQIAVARLGPTFPREVLLVFGVATLLLASLSLLRQRDLKRLLAYSSMEHMGILSIGMSFAAPLAIFGVLLHVLAHAAAKGTAFFGVGSVVRKFATKDMTKVKGAIGFLPWSGWMLVAAVLALSAMPPFGLFRSEFLIVYGGFAHASTTAASLLVVLVTVAFFGLSWYTTQTMVSANAVSGEDVSATMRSGEISGWIVASMIVGLAALLLLGIHLPSELSLVIRSAARELGVG
jgi:hydrogenase-4 component F